MKDKRINLSKTRKCDVCGILITNSGINIIEEDMDNGKKRILNKYCRDCYK